MRPSAEEWADNLIAFLTSEDELPHPGDAAAVLADVRQRDRAAKIEALKGVQVLCYQMANEAIGVGSEYARGRNAQAIMVASACGAMIEKLSSTGSAGQSSTEGTPRKAP